MKKEIRKEIKKELFDKTSKVQLTQAEFKMYAAQLFVIDDIQTLFKNQRRASESNTLIRKSSYYDEISSKRRLENSSEGSKTEIAKLIKKALVEQLTQNGHENINEKNVEEVVYKQAAEKYGVDKSAQVFELFESYRLKTIEEYLETNVPVYKWCKKVKGLGIKSSAKLIAFIEDIKRFENPAKLWAYCGVGDPKKSKRVKGEMLNFNPKMRSVLYVLSESFIKAGSQYRVVYDRRKEKTKITHPEWHKLNPDGTELIGENKHPKHADSDAKRVMIKRFLAEFYDAWYRSEGIEPPAKPYGVEIKGHHMEENIVKF